MKTIIHNEDNLTEKEINRVVKRAKVIIVNDKGEILIAKTNRNMYLPGGHVDDGETYDECLVREIKEETGSSLKNVDKKEILNIEYYSKDYPQKGINTHYISKYFVINDNLIPNYNKVKLDKIETETDFKVIYISKDKVLDVLYDELNKDQSFGSVADTIEAIKEYMKEGNS